MDRFSFLKTLGIFTLGMSGIGNILKGLGDLPSEDITQPVLFIGHGSPMNAIEENGFTQMLSKLGSTLHKPKAILVVSAHWLTKGTLVAATLKPETIYDFGGFPEDLYKVKYPSPGSPEFARVTKDLVKNTTVELDEHWGLDHGTWTILKHIYPDADIPVFQLSIDYRKDPLYHYELSQYLKDLRKKGVLIIGSGNITHNLGRVEWDENANPVDWAVEFDEKIKKNLLDQNHYEIINYEKWGKISQIAHPSNDHYLPLLYTIGLQDKKEGTEFIFEGIQHGTISMRCLKIG
jgi:4,5-DOPA dioxygenase extradiol